MSETEAPETLAPGLSLKPGTDATTYKFDDHYKLKESLSKGSFGIVWECVHQKSGEEFAVKVIDRNRLTQKDRDTVNREVSVLKDCIDIENIVRLVDFYESPDRFYVVQIYARGGDVFKRLASRTSYNEDDARTLAVYLLEAIQVLHSRKLAHRDLKPENLLLRDILDDSEILVADFGFAAYVPPEKLKTRCGTPAFVAPEVLVQNCRYDERVDMWSVGCLLFMLLGGYPPFQDRNHRGLFRKIRGADFCFHEKYWGNVSVSAKQLISSLLTVDPVYRCTAEMALTKSNWLKLEHLSLKEHDLMASLEAIKTFQARRALKGALKAVLWSVQSKFKSVDDAGFSKQIKDWDEDDEASSSMNEVVSGTGGTEETIRMSTLNRPTLKFADVYELKDNIHCAQNSSVWKCVHRESGEVLAAKVLERKDDPNKHVAGRSKADRMLHEVAVLSQLQHKNILHLRDFFEEDDRFYLVVELMEGGDLFDRVMAKNRYTEKDARDLALVLLKAVAHIHESGIVHRDIKPQNLLLRSMDDDADIVVSGFGFACRVHTPRSITTRCGTPSYVAPEILKNIPYDQSADMWSVGVILFVLLVGYPPFSDENQSSLFQKIRMGEYDHDFVRKEWQGISDEAKDLIRKLLVVDPLRRLTAREALHSKWINATDEHALSQTDLTQNMRTKTTTLKAVARSIMWMNDSKKKLSMNTEGEETLARREESEQEVKEKVEQLLARTEGDASQSE